MDERGEGVTVEDHPDPAQTGHTGIPGGAGNGGYRTVPEEGESASAFRPEVIAEHLESSSGGAAAAEAAEGTNMGCLMADLEAGYRTPRRGEVVVGTVVRVDKDGIMVDIGTKSEGLIPSHELQGLGERSEDQPKIGDEVLVYVVQPENQDGHVVLSLRKARSERGWRTAQKQFDEGKTIEAEVIDHNRGGLIVNVDGVRGFVPMSQLVGLRVEGEGDSEARLSALVGQTIPLKVLEINRKRNRLILSQRSAIQELRGQRKEVLMAELAEGQLRRGRVNSVCDFGAFVDLGGADGLVHLSELSWSQVSHPRDVVQVGDEVEVYVLGIDREKKKIALSLRRGQAEPWANIADKYQVGDLVSGRITKLVQFGAFARIEAGIEGLIHISELADTRVQHPKNVVKEGDVLQLRIIRIDATRRRLGLSLRQVGRQDTGTASGATPGAATEDLTAVSSLHGESAE